MELTFEEVRVLGCLIEKEANTPEHYPLTSNALTAACNQKSSREPVVSLSTREVDDAVMLLRQAGLARSNMGGRSSKHRHIMDEALGLTTNQTVVLSVLMLRGPQSAGELRTRTDRAIGFADPVEVEQVLGSLAGRDEPLVKDLGRGMGQSQNRWAHLLGGEVEEGIPHGAIATFSLVALDCLDPHALVAFYQKLVGGKIKQTSATEDWVRLQIAGGSDIGFQKDPNYQSPDWPYGAPQQAHLDFDVPDLERAEEKVLGLGAVKADEQPSPEEWRVFIDPAGHPFCLCKV